MLLGTLGTHAVNPNLTPSLPYDPIRDFTPNIAHSKTKIPLLVRPQPGVRMLDSAGAQIIGAENQDQAPGAAWLPVPQPGDARALLGYHGEAQGGTYWAMACASLSPNRISGQGGCARVGARGMRLLPGAGARNATPLVNGGSRKSPRLPRAGQETWLTRRGLPGFPALSDTCGTA